MAKFSTGSDGKPCLKIDISDVKGVGKLIASVTQVLRDEESQEGGWGPDVTMVAVLKDGLKAVGVDYDKLEF